MIDIVVNDICYLFENVLDDMLLLWVLCDWFRFIGMKFGCGKGLCGVCIVYFEGQVVWLCLIFVVVVNGWYVMMIEGLLLDGCYLLQFVWVVEDVL